MESPKKNVTLREEPQTSSYRQPVPPVDAEEQREPSVPSSSSQTPGATGGTPTVRNDDGADSNEPEADLEHYTNQDDTAVPSLDDMDVDMEMAGLEDPDAGLEDDNTAGNEWVMVEDQGDDSGNATEGDTKSQPFPTPQPADASRSPTTFVNTPASGVQMVSQNLHDGTLTQAATDTPDFEAGQADSQSDFDNVGMGIGDNDLVDYGDEDDDLGMDVMDGSAFGDAFHPPEDTNQMDGSDFS